MKTRNKIMFILICIGSAIFITILAVQDYKIENSNKKLMKNNIALMDSNIALLDKIIDNLSMEESIMHDTIINSEHPQIYGSYNVTECVRYSMILGKCSLENTTGKGLISAKTNSDVYHDDFTREILCRAKTLYLFYPNKVETLSIVRDRPMRLSTSYSLAIAVEEK